MGARCLFPGPPPTAPDQTRSERRAVPHKLEIASNRAGIDLQIRGERFVGRPSLRPERLVDRLHPPQQWSRAVISHRLDSSVADTFAVVSRPHPRVQSFTRSWVDPDASYQEGRTDIVRE
jgi:hypothetical protein